MCACAYSMLEIVRLRAMDTMVGRQRADDVGKGDKKCKSRTRREFDAGRKTKGSVRRCLGMVLLGAVTSAVTVDNGSEGQPASRFSSSC